MRETLQQDGITISLASGGKNRVLSVKENASTGFVWLWDEDACSPDVVKVGDSALPESPVSGAARDHMVGMPSNRYFVLEARGTGVCNLRLFYARPWEFSFDDEANGSYI